MADLKRARDDLDYFASEIIGEPLAAFQLAALALNTRISVVVAPRQSGKSRALAILAQWWAYRKRRQRILIISAGEDASRRLLADIRRMAAASPLLRRSLVDEQAGLVRLSNGSEVRSVPASERAIRGWTADLLLVDEAALVADDLLLGAALPTTAARSEARVVLASSATVASGAFYDFAIRGQAGSDHVETIRWALSSCEWITPSMVEAMRESMSETRFRAEMEGVFASGADSLFSRVAVERATADFVPERLDTLSGPARMLAGVDWGATVDRSAIAAIGRICREGEPLFGVACAGRWPAGESLNKVIADIARSPAHFETLSMETNGLGLPCAQELVRAIRRRPVEDGGATPRRWVVVDAAEFERRMAARGKHRSAWAKPRREFATRTHLVHTTADLKAATYSTLRLLMDQERLVLPAAAEELRRELLLLRVDLTPAGTERIGASSGHDDLADALMLACAPYRPSGGRWRSRLSDLANSRIALPDARLPGMPEEMPFVVTGGGLEVPRRPIWQSVEGMEVTVQSAVRFKPPQPVNPLAARARIERQSRKESSDA